ncbi:MAG: ABC transporter permease [Gemmatimonadetes bacterium]|nr:ABC transporter permease [Gemmatimonadota bacterium]
MTGARALVRDRRAVIGFAILATFAVVAVLAPILAPLDPNAQPDILRTRFLAPFSSGPDGTTYWLGTDRFGRDILSRLMYGARISLTVGMLSVAVSVLIGCVVGISAALGGGWIERALMAITDTVLAMPRLIVLLTLAALWEPSLWLVVLVLGLTGWMGIARLARAEVKGILARPYLDAARATGVSGLRLVWFHLLPNTMTPVIVAAALAVGNAITLESGLSFLGIGVPPPAPSWGNMIATGRDALVHAPWIAVLPGIFLVLAVVATNLIGDSLRDALDPTTRENPAHLPLPQRTKR